jgi:hypothetical protein
MTSFDNLIKYARHVRKTGKCTDAGLKELAKHNDLDVKYDERTGEFVINVELISKKPQYMEKRS